MDNLPIEYPRLERCDDSPDWAPATIQRHFDWWLSHRANEKEPCPICLIQAQAAENATLRTQLTALVEAAESLLIDLHTDIITFSRQGSMYQTTAEVITVRPAMRDALATACAKAKEGKR